MRRTVRSKKPFILSKQLSSQKILNENTATKFKPPLKEKVQISDLSQTFSPSDKNSYNKSDFNPENIGIDLKKEAIPTQNIPVALPVPEISKLYLWINFILCIFYVFMGVICSQILLPFFKIDQSSIPIILVICLTLIVYVVYVLMTIKCSSIRAFAKKMIGIREFQSFFYQMKSAKTWFRVELLGDRAKWSQKDEIREMIYEPKVVDKSGRFYPLPEVISYCDANSKNIKTREVSKYSEEQIVEEGKPQTLKNEQPLITIVIADYEKKYYFSNDSSKINYLNSLQEFFNMNEELFDPQRPIKGYKKMEFIVEGFQQEKSYLMVTLPSKKKKYPYQQEEKNLDKKNDSLYKLQNDSFFMVNDPNSLVVLDDDEVKQRIESIPEGLIYKHTKNKIFEQMESENIGHGKEQRLSHETETQYEKEERKYLRLFLVTYWIFLVLGFGAFYEWFILKKYVKCIQVTITKQIHERLQNNQKMKEDQHEFKE